MWARMLIESAACLILNRILSFLSTKDVVQTSILSKRWTNFWSSIPFLEFDSNHYKQDLVSFFKFVDSVLLHRDVSSVQRFRIHIASMVNLERVDLKRVLSWIIFTSRHNVEFLDVDVYPTDVNPLSFSLPLEFRVSQLFTCASLKVLKLKLYYAVLKVPNSVSLPNLQTLHLSHIKFENHGELSQMFSSCPSLQTLTIEYCTFETKQLTISTCQVESLTIICWHLLSIKISAPRLVSLNITLSKLKSIAIDELPSLVKVKIDIEEVYSSEPLKRINRAINTAESLEFGWEFIQARGKEFEVELKWIQSPFTNLKFLKLETWFTNREVQMIKTMLIFFPSLETFVVENVSPDASIQFSPYASSDEPKEVGRYEYDLSHLKLVQIEGFLGFNVQVKFVKFLIEKAMNLKKLIILTPAANYTTEEVKIRKVFVRISIELFTNPRVSNIYLDASKAGHPSLCCDLF